MNRPIVDKWDELEYSEVDLYDYHYFCENSPEMDFMSVAEQSKIMWWHHKRRLTLDVWKIKARRNK